MTPKITVAGIVRSETGYTVRFFTSDMELLRHRFISCEYRLITLPVPMDKFEAVELLIDHPDFQDNEAQEAIETFIASYNGPTIRKASVRLSDIDNALLDDFDEYVNTEVEALRSELDLA